MTAATLATDPSTERTADMSTSDYDGVVRRGPAVVEIDLFKDDLGNRLVINFVIVGFQ